MADVEILGASVASLSKTLASQLEAGHYPKPSFAADGPAAFPPDPEIQEPRLKLIEALSDLLSLATGPLDYLFLHGGLILNHDPMVLDILNQFDFFSKVPLSGSASYSEIAHATKLPELIIRRVLRYAFTMRFFAPDPADSDRVMHTALSAHAARTPLLRSWIGHAIEEARPASTKTAEALRRFSGGLENPTEEMDETAFGLSWPPLKDGRRADFWSVGEDDPNEKWRANRFADAMQASVLTAVKDAGHAVDNFDWESLGKATVVDVGGSDGALAVLLARKHPQLTFIVQDLPRVEADFKKASYSTTLPASISSRISFQPQDFFSPQPLSQPQAPNGVDVFLMRHVLHNWPDKYAVKILRNLIKALKPGGYIVVVDSVVPSQKEEGDLPLTVRKGIAGADMQMLVMLNAMERTVEDWEGVARKADERLRVKAVRHQPGARESLLELVLEG